jgi:hypothetical protein
MIVVFITKDDILQNIHYLVTMDQVMVVCIINSIGQKTETNGDIMVFDMVQSVPYDFIHRIVGQMN